MRVGRLREVIASLDDDMEVMLDPDMVGIATNSWDAQVGFVNQRQEVVDDASQADGPAVLIIS